MVASPPAVVRAELDKVWEHRPLPSVLRPLYEDPAGHLPAVAEALRRYWEVAVLPVWSRLQAVCALDLTYRMEGSPTAAWPGSWPTCIPSWPWTATGSGSTSRITATQLAGQLGLSPPAVSQHLKILRDTGLVGARGRGRVVLYQRTAAATALLESVRSSEQAG